MGLPHLLPGSADRKKAGEEPLDEMEHGKMDREDISSRRLLMNSPLLELVSKNQCGLDASLSSKRGGTEQCTR